jgi:uncharacterized protein YndB with AHSA1/START domain
VTITGDAVRATVFVALPPAAAFDVFTREVDLWWRRGVRFRNAPGDAGIVLIEPRLDGRLFESYGSGGDERVIEIGRVTTWEPPHRLVLTWRNATFAPHERTEVEVEFRAARDGTDVAVTHRGWAAIRADHPARHGLAVAEFQRMMGSWWGDQLTSLRMRVELSGDS